MPYLSCPGRRLKLFRAAVSAPKPCPACGMGVIVHQGGRPDPSLSIFQERRRRDVDASVTQLPKQLLKLQKRIAARIRRGGSPAQVERDHRAATLDWAQVVGLRRYARAQRRGGATEGRPVQIPARPGALAMTGNGRRPRPAREVPGGSGDAGLEAGALASLEAEQPLADLDQTNSDADQTHADADQRGSEADQAASDADQWLAHEDQPSSDQDQAAADRDHASIPTEPSSGGAYDASRAQRADATSERGVAAATALNRRREARQRDETAGLRDLTALSRDHTAEARDRAAGRQAAALAERGPSSEVIQALQQAVATHHARAAADRRRAATDRASAAGDRAQATLDRRQARIALREAQLDDLTGVYTRGFGLLTLQHEVDRARRSGRPLVLAAIDLDGLKQVNDRGGHAAGDVLLRAVAAAIKSKLRSYDPIVRMGGDEFACAFTDTELKPAARRIKEIKAVLLESQPAGSISVGLAKLGPNETLEDLIARGDAELYRAKGSA